MALIFSVMLLDSRTNCPSFFLFLKKSAESRMWSSAVGETISVKFPQEEKDFEPVTTSPNNGDRGEMGGVGATGRVSNELWT